MIYNQKFVSQDLRKLGNSVSLNAYLIKKDGVRRGPFGSALKKEFFVSNSNFVVYEQQNAIYDNYETRYKITEKI